MQDNSESYWSKFYWVIVICVLINAVAEAVKMFAGRI